MQFQNLIKKAEAEQVASFYAYDLDYLKSRVDRFKGLFPDYFKIHFAIKCNFHPQFLKPICQSGFGADVVSSGEVDRALESGFSPKDIIFSGVGKTKKEIQQAIEKDISQINVESIEELNRISDISKRLGKKIKVSLRVNPNVDADTHPYIRTGLLENKFGIDFMTAEKILQKADNYNVIFNGLTMHIGSQITNTEPFFEATEKVIHLFKKYKTSLPSLEVLDLGGGLGIDYQLKDSAEADDFDRAQKYANGLIELTQPLVNKKILTHVYLEPGRFLAARAGFLLSQVQYVKRTEFKNFLIVDTGMHHLMRPCLYSAHHNIFSLKQHKNNSSADLETFDIVGPICESSDVLGRQRLLPKSIKEDDWIIISEAGAYGAVMVSDYNLRDRAPEYFWQEGQII